MTIVFQTYGLEVIIDIQRHFFMEILAYYMNKEHFIGMFTALVVVRCTGIIKISSWNNTEQKLTTFALSCYICIIYAN